MSLGCVVLAAGLGKRMKSGLPKVLHKVCGVPMLQAVINTARGLRPDRLIVVVGGRGDVIRNAIEGKDVSYALQETPKGTGHALRCAFPFLRGFRGVVFVVNGDTPLLRTGTIRRFLNLHKKHKNAVSVLSFKTGNPDGYGRIVRDRKGRVVSIIEHKDAGADQKRLGEVNSGVYAINHNAMHILNEIKISAAKGEYYLTDIIEKASKKGLKTAAYCIGTEEEFMGVNTREELHRASALMKKDITEKWIGRGVTFLDAASIFIHPNASIGKDTVIYPNVFVEGKTKIGSRTIIYPNVRIQNSVIGNGVVIKDSTVIEDSVVKAGASVGPFARLRPGSVIGAKAGIGNFVEVKKSVIGERTKAGHLSYIGDAVVGKNVNVGAGTITCNYDGRGKHRTEIRDGVFIGSDTQFVAPVRVGKGAYVGAGSTITQDVPAFSLALSRVRQTNIEGWAKKTRSRAKDKELKETRKKRRTQG